MKIVCDSCGAKYSIADEKVAGKVFKIRCKRCSAVIVVRGDQDAAETDAGAMTSDAIWHVVVNGEQQGPVSPSDLSAMLSAGTIDWEAFVWTEGFDNWAALRDVEELVTQISGGAEQPEAAQQATTAAGGFGVAADAFMGEASMGADPFADDEQPTIAATEGQDLFGAAAASSSPLIGGGAAVASTASTGPRVSAEQAMTGARNENSVLFSLKNLQALATGSTTPSVNPGAAPGQKAAGFAGGEGSGLIDIRALATAASSTSAATSSPMDSEKDELLSLGGQAGGLGALASPLMAPPSDDREGGSKGVLVASILGGAVLVAGALVAFGMMSRPDAQPAAAVAPIAPVPAAAATATAVPGVAAPAAEDTEQAKAPTEEPGEAEEAAEDDESGDEDSHRSSTKASKRRRKSSSGSSSSGSSSAKEAEPAPRRAAAEPTPAPAPKRKMSSANASIDDLLEGALTGGGSKPKASAPAPASNLPDKPSRDDVLNAMNGVKGEVSACGKGAGGVAVANITVKGSTGRVTNATIEGQTGAIGSCIAKEVRKAKFPKFQSDTFKVKFPFRL